MPSKKVIPRPVKHYLVVFGFLYGFTIAFLITLLGILFHVVFALIVLVIVLALLYLLYISRKHVKLLLKWLPEENEGFFDFLRRNKED